MQRSAVRRHCAARRRASRGFTLVETLIAVGIAGVLVEHRLSRRSRATCCAPGAASPGRR